MVVSYNRLLLNNKKGIKFFHTESQLKETRLKWLYFVWFYLYDILEKKNHRDREHISGCHGWTLRLEFDYTEAAWGDRIVLKFDCGCKNLCIFKPHRTVHN